MLRVGRPSKTDARRRTVRFLELVASGFTLRRAAEEAGVKAERALDLVNDRDVFEEQVAAIRGGAADALHRTEPAEDDPRPAA